MTAAVVLALLVAQATQPIRKSDLVRMLSGSSVTRDDLVAMIRRGCTTFTPSARDRNDLKAVGADEGLLAEIDACRRAREAPRVTLAAAEVAGPAGGSATIRATVRRGNAPAAGFGLAVNLGDRVVRATTDAAGQAALVVPLTGLGTRELTITPVAGGSLAGETRVRVVTRPAGALRAAARPRHVQLGAGGRASVAVAVRDSLGNAVPGQTVQLAARGDVGGQSAVTDARGEVTFPINAATLRRDARLEVRLGGRVMDTVTVAVSGVESAARTGFVSGLGQRGRVGQRLPLPLVFEVRDSANAPLADRRVEVTSTQARIDMARDRTDSTGRVSAVVWLGQKAGPVTVSARVSSLQRQASLMAVAGPAAVLRATCNGREIHGRVGLVSDSTVVVRLAVSDAYGNALAATAPRAAAGDDGVVQVVRVAADSATGRVTLRGRKAGATNLALEAAGLREHYVANVRASGPVCGG